MDREGRHVEKNRRRATKTHQKNHRFFGQKLRGNRWKSWWQWGIPQKSIKILPWVSHFGSKIDFQSIFGPQRGPKNRPKSTSASGWMGLGSHRRAIWSFRCNVFECWFQNDLPKGSRRAPGASNCLQNRLKPLKNKTMTPQRTTQQLSMGRRAREAFTITTQW